MNDEKLIRELPNLEIIARAGEGGMSTVWKARDLKHNRMVAVKVLNRDPASNGEEITAFWEEEKAMEEIHHPGIVQAYELAQKNGILYFIMEYVDGYTFSDLLKRKQHVTEADCLLICESIASALDFAWNNYGIVHCDIKPENIMINSQGVVKLTDLGISHRFREIDPAMIEVPEHVLGTPAYISPEQVYGDLEPDCRADIYALAATLYHLSTGRILFPGLNAEDTMRAHCQPHTQALDPRAYHPELSEGFVQLLEAMLVKDRDYRISDWANVFQMCQDIENGVKFKPRNTNVPSSIKLN